MKRILQTLLCLLAVSTIYGQTTYYWVGGPTPTSITAGTNWNTNLDGSGTNRPSTNNVANSTDILVFDGTNIRGTTPTTGTVNLPVSGTVHAGQLKFVNNAAVVLYRTGGSTGTINIYGGAGDDFIIDAGANVSLNSSDGAIVIALTAPCSGRVSGFFSMLSSSQNRIANTTAGTGKLVFTNGSRFTSNITGLSSYAFGSNTQSAPFWVVFEAGSALYYEGGTSPMASNSDYSPIDFKPGSVWRHRATNTGGTGLGSYFNNRRFADIIVENNATLIADGPIYGINNLTVAPGATFSAYTSGQTSVFGNLIIDGTLSAQSGSSNAIVLANVNGSQAIGGSGTITAPSLVIADQSTAVMNNNVNVTSALTVYGKLDLTTKQAGGTGSFFARGSTTASPLAGNIKTDSLEITFVTGIIDNLNGLTISGNGIQPGTRVVGYSASNQSICISKPTTATANNVTLSFSSNAATLATAHAGGFGAATGSVTATGDKDFDDGINYIFNAATATPFGTSTLAIGTTMEAGVVDINAAVTANKTVAIVSAFNLNNKYTLPAQDSLIIRSGAQLNGTFGTNNYIITQADNTNGNRGLLKIDNPAASQIFPVGTAANYLPATIDLPAAQPVAVSVFEGITANGLPNGSALTAAQLQKMVNAVWRINDLQAVSAYNLKLQWVDALEGSSFTTLANTDIGIVANNGSVWALVTPGADNTTNTSTASVSTFGSFSLGAVPQVNPFVFNAIPDKIYGAADFNAGATSLNTTEPIIYTTDNSAIATVVNGNIHITGTGTVNVTATQASDGFYPAVSMTQPLTINKAPLTIRANDLTKFEAEANPTLTASYSGFVYGETSTVLTTQPVLTTTATVASPGGTYPITVGGAAAANYTITYINGTLTVIAKQTQTITFAALPVKIYGNADFAAGATSTNTTIPVTLSSSNTSVATIIGNNIHIVGAGTANITASQAGSQAFFPATAVTRALTVNKASLTIRVRDTTKVEGQPNPAFTIVYTGFVLGETAANLTTPPNVATAATTTSPGGYYTLTPQGAVTNNYNITYTAGRLTILPADGTDHPQLLVFMSNSSTLNVRVFSNYPALSDIGIFDMNGKLVARKNVFLPEGFMNTTIPIDAIPPGIYIVKVFGSGVKLEQKIVIVR